MLKVTVENKGTVISARLSGAIDENSDLQREIGKPVAPLHLFCSEVIRINSVGIKLWIKYFSSLQQANIPFVFQELSPPLVEQLNVIKNFHCGGQVASVLLPYRCEACQDLQYSILSVADARRLKGSVPARNCSKCNAPCVFDEFPDEYLEFAEKLKD